MIVHLIQNPGLSRSEQQAIDAIQEEEALKFEVSVRGGHGPFSYKMAPKTDYDVTRSFSIEAFYIYHPRIPLYWYFAIPSAETQRKT